MSVTTLYPGGAPLRAAAIRLDETTSEIDRQLRRHEEWQSKAWGAYNSVGEIHYGTNIVADSLARGRLFAGMRPEPGAELVPVDDEDSPVPESIAAASMALLSEFRSPIGGQSQLIRLAALGTMVVGEWYLVEHTGDDALAGWHVRSTEETKITADGVEIKGLGTFARADVSRVWWPHAQRFEAADSGLRAVLGSCETVLLIDRQFRAALRSRLFAGLLLFPNGMRQGTPSPSTDNAVDGAALLDPAVADIVRAISLGIQNEGDPSAVTPNALWGSREDIGAVKHIDLAIQVDPDVVRLREATLRRIAQGLDIPPEIVLGLAESNHWTGWLVSESFIDSLEPKKSFLTDAFTSVYLRPGLDALDIDEEWVDRIEVGLDLSALQRRPTIDEDAKYAFGEGAIGREALRRYLGLSEADAPEPGEVLERLIRPGTAPPEVLAELARIALGIQVATVAPADTPPVEALPPGDDDAPANGPPVEPVAASASALAAIDAVLVERLFAAARAAVHRALERAGNKARAKIAAAHRPAVRHVEPERVCSHLGPTLLAAAGLTDDELLAGALAALAVDWRRWVHDAQEETIAAVLAEAGDEVDEDALGEIRARLDADAERSWEWTAAALLALLGAKLASGEEVADWEVRKIVRLGTAIAGGAVEVSSIAEAAGGARAVADGAAVAGIASGPGMLALLGLAGVGIAGWQWLHGHPAHPFPEHQALDGEIRSAPEDFGDNWPGDHAGCQCHIAPLIGG